ncbi:MAG: response regulator [Candidatus Omnitrophica bacterium]|nr:response regulator [Candidatus Omnitrophota bacterium]
MIPSRILVVDDEEGIRRLMVKALERDYEVHAAADGEEGLALAHRVQPHLILLDLRMPRVDGLTALARLKAHPQTRAIPVVITSVHGETDLLLEAQRSGAVDQLIKPFTLETLRAVVQRHIRLEMTQSKPVIPRPAVKPGAKAKPVILVIDDEEGIRKLIQRALEPDYTVALAADGREGLAQAQALQPKLIFLDLHLPDWDGLSVLGRLKTDAGTKAIPVVIASVSGETDVLMEGQRSGAVDYLIKPFRIDELRAMAQRHLLIE